MKIEIPPRALVLLVGPAASGKTTFARKHFRTARVLSSDAFRELVCDDAKNQAASRDAFDVLEHVAERRLARGRPTVIDATNLRRERRRPFLRMARRYGRPAVAILFKLPRRQSLAWNACRTHRTVPEDVIDRHHKALEDVPAQLEEEGYQGIHVLDTAERIDAAAVRLRRARRPPARSPARRKDTQENRNGR